MFGILARLLEFLYSIWPSYAGSIILFTVIIMLVLAPLTFKSTRSMLAMQALQPEMKKLQNQYKDDRQKLNEEMMKFYQENKISPLGGCLPMLLQMPVFFILYWVLLGLTKRGPFGADLGHSVACSLDGVNACVSGVGTYANAGFFHPAYLDSSSDLYQALSTTRVMESFGIDLSQSAWNIFSQGLIGALPYVAMVLVVMALTYFQQQQIQRRQPKNADQNPTQQMMMKVMPIAMGFIYIIIPAAVVVYFLVSSLFRIGQQAMVTRTFYSGPNAVAISTTATEGGPDEQEGSWSRFKATLPKVGQDAKEERSRSFDRDSSEDDDRPRPSSKSSSKSSGTGAKKPSQRQRPSGSKGGSGKTRPKPGSSNGSGGKGSAKKKTGSGSSSSGKAGSGKTGSGKAAGKAGRNGSGQSAKSKGGPKERTSHSTGSSGKSSGKSAGKSTDRTTGKSSGKSNPKAGGKSTAKTAGTGSKKSSKKTADSTDVERPSRAAPSRKAPPRPSDGKKNR